ncbi:MAG: uroporphyrinogen-III synthase [Gemmatimonadota bacterium]
MSDAGNGVRDGGAPLAGLRVAVTRPRGQAAALARALDARGAEPVICPLIRIAAPSNREPLRRAAREAEGYDWIVLTSVNGVERLAAALREAGEEPASALGPPRRVACIGPATASALKRRGVEPAVVPDEYVAEAVLEAIVEASGTLTGSRILLPRAAGARAVLREELERRGADVEEVEAYRAARDEAGAAALREAVARGALDIVTFTASSTVERFVAALGPEEAASAARAMRIATIGPITAETARRHGLAVDVQATEYTIPGLVDALCAHVRGEGAGGGDG